MAGHRSGGMQPVQEFSPENVHRDLANACTQGQLDAALKKHWCQYVPLAYSCAPDADTAREDRRAQKLLFRPMETFLCSGNPDEIFQKLKEQDNPPELCGRVFKMGEPTYSCRDCGMDPTCVLCIECFQKSAHKKHRYKMSTSGGGGYCDCGDREAWKMEPFCDIHKRGLEKSEKVDPIENLDPDLRDRARQLFSSAIRYAVEMLTWQHCDGLPVGLEPPARDDDTYATILFNDEVHTYEQVINTLMRAVDCTHKQAVDFATTVDREGRSCVKVGRFADCEKARALMERRPSSHGDKALKVLVMHISVVAHLNFAQKILSWLQQVISYSDGLRQLFCVLSLSTSDEEGISLVERIMLADTQLWKAARVLSHQLFMAGVLMDQECKKQFAILFTKMYPRIMQDFIEDDHDHSVCAVSEAVQIFTVPTLHYHRLMQEFIQDDHYRSVSATSCSVQIFTVPTLARLLITEHNLLEVILNTFLEQCSTKISGGKFVFQRNERNQSFRRAQYMLYDLKYALTCKPKPDEWNDKLRTSFVKGFKALLELLKFMQGMDAVTRQSGQHIEFEPEWEGAFNLQLKLADNIAVILDWCSTDESVLLKCFKATINALHECRDQLDPHKMESCEVASQKYKCIKYDVSSLPVSIHLPVSRILAGLYPSLNQFCVSLAELHKKSPMDLMEPSLRCQVMIAQTQAGMWRRNGYSLLNQIYFYHNVRCRSEMFDKDIILLQAAGALLDSNEFLIHLLNKFNLLNWAKKDYDTSRVSPQEDLVRQTVTVAEEFLTLLLYIIGERFQPGVGEVTHEDMVKREIIHQLCIQPMAHSELTKALPEDPNHETGIEDVVNLVAVFRKPVGNGKGLYEVKEECFEQYNPYFYHYTRAEQSKSEESQRKRKKQANEDQALPPPCPPPFASGFQPLICLLDCDVMLDIMHTILKRTTAAKSRSWSETQFEKILHLIGIALHEEKRAHQNGITFNFIKKAIHGSESVFSLLESLVGHPNLSHEAQKNLLSWVLKIFAEVRKLRDENFALVDTVMVGGQDEKQKREKKRKADMAAKRRARLMAEMSKMQKDFIKGNPELFGSTSTELQPAGSDMDISQSLHSEEQPVAVGARRSPASLTGVIRQTCIVCQEEQDITHTGRAMVLAAFVQKSTVLSKVRGQIVEDPGNHDPLFLPSNLMVGAFNSTCGHVMHSDCWQGFYDAIVAKERRRPYRFRHHFSYDIEKGEFLCPLCETLSNTVIPIVPHLSTLLKDNEHQEVELSLNDWLDGMQKTVHASIQEAKDKESEEELFLFVPCPLSSITKMMAESVAKNFQLLFEYVYLDCSGTFSDSILEMLTKFSSDIYAIGLGVDPDDKNIRVPIMAWTTCAYSIMAIEQGLRDDDKPLFGSLPSRQADCLAALVRFAAVCNQVIQPDVVKEHCVNLLTALLLDSSAHRLQETPCLLDIDMFHYLVSLCLSLPTLYAEDATGSTATTRIPTAGLNDQHTLQLVFTAHLVQIMLTADFSTHESMELEAESEADQLVSIYQKVRHLAGLDSDETPSGWQLANYLKDASLPFLRCAGLFFHYLSGVTAPEKLTDVCGEEFEVLCDYLSMTSSLTALFPRDGLLASLISSWCGDDVVRQKLSAGTEQLVRYPIAINRLIELPDDYSELINKVSTFTCPKSDGDDSRAPTMCLVCGQMLCSQSYCCQTDLDGLKVGAATAHAHTCGAGTGLFLRVRECQVLLLSGRTKGCFFPPPYLDDYGETDQGLRRGNPLHLCPERYKKLQKLWLSHTIPEEIAHSLESNNNLLSIDWQHL